MNVRAANNNLNGLYKLCPNRPHDSRIQSVHFIFFLTVLLDIESKKCWGNIYSCESCITGVVLEWPSFTYRPPNAVSWEVHSYEEMLSSL